MSNSVQFYIIEIIASKCMTGRDDMVSLGVDKQLEMYIIIGEKRSNNCLQLETMEITIYDGEEDRGLVHRIEQEGRTRN